MECLLNLFKKNFYELQQKLADAMLISAEKFPVYRANSAYLLESFNPKILVKLCLSYDLFFVIHQGLAADNKIRKHELVFVGNFVRFLSANLEPARPCYGDFKTYNDEMVFDVIKFWHRDPDIFGFENKTTKFLLQDLVSHFAIEMNYPELFIVYQDFISKIYQAILKQIPDTNLQQSKMVEAKHKFNKLFVKDFYRKIISQIITTKISSHEDAKKNLKIEAVNPYLELFVKSCSLFETRSSNEIVTPWFSSEKITSGVSANLVDPDLLKFSDPKSMEEQKFEFVVPESRRCSKCPNCIGVGLFTCIDCRGKKKVKCKDCVSGKVTCKRCDGSGEESYSDSHEKMVQCSCDRGLVTRRDGFSTFFNAVTINNPDAPVLNDVSVNKCARCRGLGFLQQTVEITKKRPCAFCSTQGEVVCRTCNGTTKAPCLTCGTEGTVPCDTCKSGGMVEFHQLINVHRYPNFTENKFTTVPKEVDFKAKKNHFICVAILNGKKLSDKVLNEPLNRNFTEGFRKGISNTLALSSNINGFQSIAQECQLYVCYYYHIQYSFYGVKSESWWHPSMQTLDFALAGIMKSVLELADNEIKNKMYFQAAKKIIQAENLSKAVENCMSEFQKYTKKLSLFMKFMMYIARHFVNTETIW